MKYSELEEAGWKASRNLHVTYMKKCKHCNGDFVLSCVEDEYSTLHYDKCEYCSSGYQTIFEFLSLKKNKNGTFSVIKNKK
jgi:hypothetical protein